MGRKSRTVNKGGGIGSDGLSRYARKVSQRGELPTNVNHGVNAPPSSSTARLVEVLATIPPYYSNRHWFTLPVTDNGETLFLHTNTMNGIWGLVRAGDRVICKVDQAPPNKKYRAVLQVSLIQDKT